MFDIDENLEDKSWWEDFWDGDERLIRVKIVINKYETTVTIYFLRN